MSERHFDYTAMQEAYQGLETEFSNIADVLDGIDKQYRDAVNVSEEAIFGDLGSQLLLDWDNASSNFPGFMQNFENWSAVVAASGGNYAQFENDIAGFKSVDNGSYLGVSAQQNGITTNYVEGSNIRDYANSIAGQYENDMQSLKALYELTGAEYAVANSQSILKRHKIVTGIAIGCEAVGLAFLALPVIGKIFGTAAAGTAAAGTTAAGTTAAGTTAAGTTAAGTTAAGTTAAGTTAAGTAAAGTTAAGTTAAGTAAAGTTAAGTAAAGTTAAGTAAAGTAAAGTAAAGTAAAGTTAAGTTAAGTAAAGTTAAGTAAAGTAAAGTAAAGTTAAGTTAAGTAAAGTTAAGTTAAGTTAAGTAAAGTTAAGTTAAGGAAGTAAAGTAAAGTTAAGGAAGTAATGAAKSSALKTIFGNIGRGIKGTATKVGNVKIGGKTIAQTTFGQHVAQGGIKGVAKQTLGTIAVFETGEIVGEAKGGH